MERDGVQTRDYPRLVFGGAHLDELSQHDADLRSLLSSGGGSSLASGAGSTRDFAQGMKLLMSAAGDPRIVDTVKQRIEAVCQTTRDTSEADLCASRP